jgi:hypothetical protein
VLAIVLLLVVLPFAVAFISNVGDTAGKDYENSFDWSEPGNNAVFVWNNGGANYSSLYSSGDCAHVVEGQCTDTGAFWLDQPSPATYSPILDQFFHDAPGLVLSQTHARAADYGTDPYVGNSGDGPFEWLIMEDVQNAIPNNQTFDRLRYSFIDHQASYNCNTHPWEGFDISYSITFQYDNETKGYGPFYAENVSNKYKHFPYPSYHEECNVGIELEYDFNSFESLEMVNWNSGNWNETRFYVKIDNIERNSGLNLYNAELPWAGNEVFTLTSEYSSIDEVAANFFINMGTLILTVATFALAVASTPYWDPLKNIFTGAV